MQIDQVLHALKTYEGPEIRIMEVCGTHTVAIMQGGLRSLLSDRITLVSGPGCPVCVTACAYIDRCIALAMTPGVKLYSFGDMMKIKGSTKSLSEAKASGAQVSFVYSPFDVLTAAEKEPDTMHVFAAVGFETTVPIYALLLQQAAEKGLKNIQLLTAIKTILPALETILSGTENDGTEKPIHGFIAPGHVSAIIGKNAYLDLARRYHRPFTVAGFSPEHIVAAVYQLLQQINSGRADVTNLYTGVVAENGNAKAQKAMSEVFEPGDALWRGIGTITNSSLYLNRTYAAYDAGSQNLGDEPSESALCRCRDVILGNIHPIDCPLFGTACTPAHAQGACMVSGEGACGIWYRFSPKKPGKDR